MILTFIITRLIIIIYYYYFFSFEVRRFIKFQPGKVICIQEVN